eukprot:4088998-Pyramimonas_sp.AAC.1
MVRVRQSFSRYLAPKPNERCREPATPPPHHHDAPSPAPGGVLVRHSSLFLTLSCPASYNIIIHCRAMNRRYKIGCCTLILSPR